MSALPALDGQIDVVLPLQAGLFQGCAYGLLALGIVLLYKSNRILNFAQGEFAGVSLIISFCLDSGYSFFPKVPYVLAIVLGVSASVLVAILTQLFVIRPLFTRPRVVLVVATVGVSLLLIALEGFLFPSKGVFRQVSDGFSSLSSPPFRLGLIPVQWYDLVRLVVLVSLALAALVFFKRTATGTAVLAVSQDPVAASVVGIEVQKISLITWAIAGFLGGIAGVLPVQAVAGTVLPGVFTGIVLVAAFTAAVLGGITSLPGAFVGGIVLGLVQAFANADATKIPIIKEVPAGQGDLVVFLLLLLVLLVRPAGLLGKEV